MAEPCLPRAGPQRLLCMVPSVEMLKDDEVFREPTLTERNEVIRGVALGGE